MRSTAFGLLDMLAAIAFLVIVLGLAVSLARYVRSNSAERITSAQLATLEADLDGRRDAFETDRVEQSPPASASESDWAAYVARSNQIVQKLTDHTDVVTDAWGNPVGYMSSKNPAIGMAPHDKPFFFSAGPDGLFLTQDDNLYSYEELSLRPAELKPTGQRE